MTTKPVLATLAAAVSLLVAPTAFAQDYCVSNSACVSAGGINKASVEDALTAANANPEQPLPHRPRPLQRARRLVVRRLA